MRIGMAGPIVPSEFVDYLDARSRHNLPPGLGGTPVNQLSIELLNRGHSLTVFTLDKTIRDEVILEGDNLRICIGPYRSRPRERALDAFRLERQYIESAIRREHTDIVHAQWTYEFALGTKRSGIPFVVTAHDAPINILKTSFDGYRAIRTGMAYAALRGVRYLAAVSPHVANHLRHWRLFKGPIAVIPNGLPPASFELYDTTIAAQLNRRNQPPVFATVLNGWAGPKNGPAALRAFAIVRKSIPEARLVMFGTGHGPGEAASVWAHRFNLDTNVDFAGYLPYPKLMQELSNRVDVLIHPAREEAHCMVLIECMALGIPVIGGMNSGGVPWTLAEGDAGLLVDIESPVEVARAMCTLADHGARRKLANAGRVSVADRFPIQVVTDSYLTLYKRALQDS
jgi:L-malate glycosyltransferase